MRRLLSVVAALLAPLSALAADPLADEIARSSAAVAALPTSDPFAKDIRESAEPMLERARAALAAGRRCQALHLYAQAFELVTAGSALVKRTAAERADMAVFEAQWRAGADLRTPAVAPPWHPALLRALGEAAAAQGPVLYDASLDYGRSTTPDSGFYYLEAARAERDFVAVLERLQERTALKAPPVRDIAVEIDALRGELLSAYVPPASIDRHSEFIAASSALKEAGELNAAGRHHGALLKYLQGALRLGRLRAPLPQPPEARLPRGVDHSIAQAFVEAASEASASPDAERRRTAQAVSDVVLPAYLRAIAPAVRTPPAAHVPPATVTLVRWPYT